MRDEGKTSRHASEKKDPPPAGDVSGQSAPSGEQGQAHPARVVDRDESDRKTIVTAGETALYTFSASQIDTFNGCQRKWGWKYLAGIKSAPNDAAKLGTEVDDTQLQPYLRDGRALDFTRRSGYIAAPALVHLPAPKSEGLEVQKHFLLPGLDPGFQFQGLIDLWLPPRDARYVPCVTDFKTTGNWNYALTPKTLATNVQAMLYATWAMWFTGAREIDLHWLYLATKGTPKAKPVRLRVISDDVADQFLAINETAREMHRIKATVTDPLELPPTVSHCSAYGGCPHQARCNLSPSQKIDAAAAAFTAQQGKAITMSETPAPSTGSFLARMAAKRAAEAGGAPAPVATKPGGPHVENLPSWATAPVDPLTGSSRPLGINPPESLLPPAPAVGVPQTSAAAAPAAEAPKRRGPGRPKKDPLGADVNAHATPAPTPAAALIEALSEGPAAFAFPAVHPVAVHESPPASVTVTWAKETFAPIAYNSFDIGPFQVTGAVQPGETIVAACARLSAELTAFAERARDAKAISNKKALDAFGSSR